ncbi:hypothetical protein M758_12G134000 [Ceratodon purpureus]|nr:hypothetical protein M758_12G134000 [Ceratodon purpureus]
MQMEMLGSLPADIGLLRSSGPVKKPLDDHVMVIDLEDEIEEEEEWELEPVRSTQTEGIANREIKSTGLTSCDEQVHGKKTEVDEKEGLGLVGTSGNPISLRPIFQHNAAEVDVILLEDVDAASQGTGLVGSNDNEDDPFAFEGDEFSFWKEVIALEQTSQGVDGSSQQCGFIDLSSSESGDDGDGDMVDIAEEEEKINTTLSSEEAPLLAEVMKAIKGGGDLKKFKVESLKLYLRHYGLRMVGVKAVLISRIQEHLKIKDGRGEEIYPRSSFIKDCTGDVCQGDTVLFQHAVFDTPFDIERRCASGPPLGQRWVAGKVVNESYGAAKQQHTFTIEVLWSTGTKPFSVMHPVRIKGRNLYRIQTLRQLWPDETKRQMVLDEKHARGAEARAHRRAMKSLKSRGRARSKQDARVHPYLRSHTMDPHSAPPTSIPQNSVQYESVHTQNVYQSRVPATHTASMQHETYTERTVYQGFTERYPAPEPTVLRGRNLHSRQNHHEGSEEILSAPEPAIRRGWSFQSQQNQDGGFTERNPALEPTASHGRNFHSQQSRYEGRAQAHHGPLRVYSQNSMQHGRVHAQRQVTQNPARQRGPTTIQCSNGGCEKLGAKQCISRSCAVCCSRNGTTRGRCPRHQ